jgi:transcriptional regulator with XRE-family HTH domain
MDKATIKPEHQEFLKKVGESIKTLRTKKKIKITDLVDEIGMHRNTYRQIEQGKTYFKISALLRILDYHKISYSDFMKNLKL